MALNAEAYARQLKSLLPTGAAWQAYRDGVLFRILLALGDELARIDGRGDALMREADPRTALETLPDWERTLALPGRCVTTPQTVEARRAAIVAKHTTIGGQSRRFFIELAAALGYEITITEFHPFRVDVSAVGDALYDEDWVHTWQVNAPDTTIEYFRVGSSVVGEPLRSWGNVVLECVLNERKPAHTNVIFAYADTTIPPALDFSINLNSQYIGGGFF